MPRLPIPLTGWNTASRAQHRMTNLRLVDGVLSPRPKAERIVALSQALNAAERFVGLTEFIGEASAGVLGSVYLLQTAGHGSGARFWIKRFELSLGPTPVFRTDAVGGGDSDNFFTATGSVPQFLSLGDKLYANVGSHFFDCLGYTYPIKCFQCTARNSVASLAETHGFTKAFAIYEEDTDTGVTAVNLSGTPEGTWLTVSYGAGGSFSFILDATANPLPQGIWELPFLCSLSNTDASSKLEVQFYDEDEALLTTSSSLWDGTTTRETQLLDLTNPTVIRRRSVFVNPADLRAQGKRIAKIGFVGTGFPGAGDLVFAMADAVDTDKGLYLTPDGETTLSPTVTYAGLTQATSQALPAGVGVASALAQDSIPAITGQDQILRDAYRLGLGVTYTTPTRTTLTAWFADSEGVYRSVPVTTEDVTVGGTTTRTWYFDDLTDESIARSDAYMGWDFPHVETGTTPKILAAAFWNGRLCLSTSEGQLWISDPADSFAFGGASEGRILDLPMPAYQMIPKESALYLVLPDGVYVLAGVESTGVPLLRRVKIGRGRSAGVSDSLLLLADGVYSQAGDELTRPLRPELLAATFLTWQEVEGGIVGVVEEQDGSRILWEHYEGAWSRFELDDATECELHTGAHCPSHGWVIAARDGLYTLTGDPTDTWEYEVDVELPVKCKITAIEVEGQGRCEVSVNGLTSTESVIQLPDVVTGNLFQHAAQLSKVTITLRGGPDVPGSSEASIERLWIEVEPIATKGGGKIHGD